VLERLDGKVADVVDADMHIRVEFVERPALGGRFAEQEAAEADARD